MALKQRGLSFSLILVLLLGGFLSPVAASELSEAETRYLELKRTYDANLEALNVNLVKSEQEAQQCLAQLSDSTSTVDSTAREICQQDLLRIRSEKSVKSAVISQQKIELEVLESRVQTLRASSGSSQSSGSAGSSSGGSTTSSAQSATSPAASSSTQTSNTQSSQSSSDNSAKASPAPTPAPARNSESQVATPAPTPSSSSSPSAAPESKVSAAAKPAPKKRTITCVKAKVTRKVTAVKPVCPKGFKIRKK